MVSGALSARAKRRAVDVLPTPRVPVKKTRLSWSSGYSIDLLAGYSYAFVLNPQGLGNHSPVFAMAKRLADDQKLNFIVPHSPITLTGRVVAEDPRVLSDDGQSRMQAKILMGTRLVSSLGNLDSFGHFSLLT